MSRHSQFVQSTGTHAATEQGVAVSEEGGERVELGDRSGGQEGAHTEVGCLLSLSGLGNRETTVFTLAFGSVRVIVPTLTLLKVIFVATSLPAL